MLEANNINYIFINIKVKVSDMFIGPDSIQTPHALIPS